MGADQLPGFERHRSAHQRVALGSGGAQALLHDVRDAVHHQLIPVRSRGGGLATVYQTMGLAFIFIPINTLSYVGMPPNKSNQVSGITNLSRNLGGSIGISMLSTFLLRLAQKHQVYLSAHAGAGDAIFQSQIAGLTKNFSSQGAPPDQATDRAYAMVQRMIAGQASTLAYIDIISTGAIAVACLAPLVFIMKKPRRGAKAAAAH